MLLSHAALCVLSPAIAAADVADVDVILLVEVVVVVDLGDIVAAEYADFGRVRLLEGEREREGEGGEEW